MAQKPITLVKGTISSLESIRFIVITLGSGQLHLHARHLPMVGISRDFINCIDITSKIIQCNMLLLTRYILDIASLNFDENYNGTVHGRSKWPNLEAHLLAFHLNFKVHKLCPRYLSMQRSSRLSNLSMESLHNYKRSQSHVRIHPVKVLFHSIRTSGPRTGRSRRASYPQKRSKKASSGPPLTSGDLSPRDKMSTTPGSSTNQMVLHGVPSNVHSFPVLY